MDRPTMVATEDTQPCMKTMSVKILAKCWQSGYTGTKGSLSEVLLSNERIDPEFLSQFLCSCAKKEVADSISILIERQPADLLVPLLNIRAEKELYTLDKELPTADSVRKNYMTELMSAWQHIRDITQQ